jgi:hypothetical protein
MEYEEELMDYSKDPLEGHMIFSSSNPRCVQVLFMKKGCNLRVFGLT